LSTPSPSPDNRFLAVRYVVRESDEFSLDDDGVRRFIALRDEGRSAAEIGAELGLAAEPVADLIRADEAQKVAHRIATGEEPMYPAPAPGQEMVDTRSGSATVPLIALGVIFVIILIYLAVR
jgi:hypothetical protein